MKRWLFSLLLLCAIAAQAGVVFEQAHNGSGTLFSSSRYQANGTDYDQFVWDSFSVPAAQAVTEIRWRGGYDPNLSYWGGDLVNFRVSIYESTPGLSQPLLGPGYPGTPATLVAYDTGDKAGETSAGVFGGVPMFDYHFVLPTVFQAQAGKLYWIQIEADFANGIPYWGFAAAAGNGSYFRRIPAQADYYFQFVPGDAAFSIVTSDGPVHTIAAAGHAFVNWTEAGVIVSTSALYTFPATADRTLVANFLPTHAMVLTSSSTVMGTVAGANNYLTGSSVTATAAAKPGYVFLNWTEAGNIVSTVPAYSFTLLAPRTLRANFAAGFTVTAGSSFAPSGSVSGGGGHATGSLATLLATPADGYRFTTWTENGATVGFSASYSFTVTASRTLVANFVPVLGIASTLPDSLVITWPASAAGWTLQESTDLATGGLSTSTWPVTVASNQNQVTVPNPTGRRFFRLNYP